MDPLMLLWLQNQQQQQRYQSHGGKQIRQGKSDPASAGVSQLLRHTREPAANIPVRSVADHLNTGGRSEQFACENKLSARCFDQSEPNDNNNNSNNRIKMNPHQIPQYFDENSGHKQLAIQQQQPHPQLHYTQQQQPLQGLHQHNGQVVSAPSSVGAQAIGVGRKQLSSANRKRAAEVPVVTWLGSSGSAQAGGPAPATCTVRDHPPAQLTPLVNCQQQQHPQQLVQHPQQQQPQSHSTGSNSGNSGHTGVSPVPSLSCSDIGEMDLDFWDVDQPKQMTSNGDIATHQSLMGHGGSNHQMFSSSMSTSNNNNNNNNSSNNNNNNSNNQLGLQQQKGPQQIYGNHNDCSLSPTVTQAPYQINGADTSNADGRPAYYQALAQGTPLMQSSLQNISLESTVKQSIGYTTQARKLSQPLHEGLVTSAPDANNNNSSSNCGSEGSQGDIIEPRGSTPKKSTNSSGSGGPVTRQQEELCLVCGDRASGYHYNALTCEGCKGFFRRSITKNSVYSCKYGDQCDIDMYMRRKCQQCRLRKCLSVGMRPECVVPESQNVMKRQSKKKGDVDHPGSEGNGPEVIEVHDEKPNITALNRAMRQVRPLTADQESLINKLVYYQLEFESPSAEDVTRVTGFPLGSSEKDSQKRFEHITEITILTVQLIVEFSKRVPGFDTLQREDQITLLKACSSEVMMLRGARKYDVATDSIVFANNQPYTLDNYRSASVGDNADALFQFCRNMCNLRVDNAEYALLTAIVIFSERPYLLEPDKVEQIQMFYVDTLRMYSENHRSPPGSPSHFAKLLSILTELRTLGNMNSEMCFSLKIKKNKELPPFLAEIWDIQC